MTAAEADVLATHLDRALDDALVAVGAAFASGADAVLVGDDLAGPSGPLLSPDVVLDALVPRYERLAREAEGGGLPAVFHSDGDIRALLPALWRSGFSAVHVAGTDSDAFATSALAARRTGLVVLGGIAAQALPENARRDGERAAAVASSLGGVIVCDDGGITTLEQFRALQVALGAARAAYRQPQV